MANPCRKRRQPDCGATINPLVFLPPTRILTADQRCFSRYPTPSPVRSLSADSTSIQKDSLLLTNDGELARKLELPATGWRRRYRVRVHGRVQADALFSLEDGLNIAGTNMGRSKPAWNGNRVRMLGSRYL